MRRRRPMVASAIALLLVTVTVAAAESPPPGIGIRETAKGPVLTDTHGMTLYIFDKDTDGVSNCVEKCIELWPVARAAQGTDWIGKDFTVLARPDGVAQFVYRGHPLYSYAKDMIPGDVTGDGVRDLWHIAKP